MADSPVSSPRVLLPPEIHNLILENLDRGSLLELRLTCTALNFAATPVVFKRLHVWLKQKSLQKLVNIANEPHLHKYVKFIDFDIDLFYDVGYPRFEHEIFPGCGFRYAFEKKTDGTVLTSKLYIDRKYRKQPALKESKGDLGMFAHAISAFSALECIRLVDSQSHMDESIEGLKMWKEALLRQDLLNTASCSPPMPLGGKELRILIEALAASGGSKLESLYLQLYSANVSNLGFYSTLSAKDVHFAKLAFSGLKKLTLSLPPVRHTITDGCRSSSTESSVTTILEAATELEDLRLELPTERRSTTTIRGSGCWKDIIPTNCVGKLKVLNIKGALLDDEAQFVSFLIQSCQGLKKLHLSTAVMVEGSWDLVFETIRSLPELADLALEDLWHGVQHDGFMALRGSNFNPKPPYEYFLKCRVDNPLHSMCQARQAHIAKQYRRLTIRDSM